MASDRIGRRPLTAPQRFSAPRSQHYVQNESEKDEILHRYASPNKRKTFRDAPSVAKRSTVLGRKAHQGPTGASHHRPPPDSFKARGPIISTRHLSSADSGKVKVLPAATGSCAPQKEPLSRAEMELCASQLLLPATRESASHLLHEARSWCSRFEKTADPKPIQIPPPPTRRKPFSSAENKKNPHSKTTSQDNVKLEVASLRSDIESVRREIKHLGKKVSKKQKISKEPKILDPLPEVVESPVPKPVKQISQTVLSVSQQSSAGEEAPTRLGICTLQDVHIRRALAKQTAASISICPQQKISKLANVRFSTFAHEPAAEKATPTAASSVPEPSKSVETCDREASTDQVQVSSLQCQTSPPPQLLHIFTQTEQAESKTESKSVAVQSSPEAKTAVHVQTEEVQVKSVAVETEPEQMKFAKVAEELGPAGDASFATTKEIIVTTGNLSPIMEVHSENISPLVTPREQLPETSPSPSSQQIPQEKKPKSVAFADLPMLLRLRSPAMRFKIPNYSSKWQHDAKNNSLTTDDESETVTKSHELETMDSVSLSSSRSTSPTSTSSLSTTEKSEHMYKQRAIYSIPKYQMQRIRSLSAKVAPHLRRSHDDSDLSEGQVWPTSS